MYNLEGKASLLECQMNLSVLNLQYTLPVILSLELSPVFLVCILRHFSPSTYLKSISDVKHIY